MVFFSDLRKAEIKDLWSILGGEHDITRLDVAMYDAVIMSMFKCTGYLDKYLEKSADIHSFARRDGVQRTSVDIFHRDERLVVEVLDRIDRRYIRVIKCCRGSRFVP